MQQVTVVAGRVRRMTRTLGLTAPGRRRWGPGLVVAWLLWLSWAGIGYGAPGDLDLTFGSGGIAITFGPSDRANALIQQPDGKLVAAGASTDNGISYVMLVRYHSDSRVDASFGSGGKVTTPVATRGAAALIQQPDGKLVVAGFSQPLTGASNDVLLVRYLPDGRLDATFGVGGAVTTDFGANEMGTALVLQPDGKLVVAGVSSISLNWSNTILARYHPDGRLDDAFGVGGKVSVNLGTDGIASVVDDGVSALLLQSDGKLVVTGGWLTRVTPSTLFVARFQPDGRLDPTFGQGGLVTTYEGSGGRAPRSAGAAVIQQPDGRLVVAGFREVPSSMSAGTLLARYLPDGRLDPTFGTAGVSVHVVKFL
jgi:uncharacterized delta-60 repeat protein